MVSRVVQYLNYRLKAGTRHDVHSPFIYDFVNTFLHEPVTYYAFEPIEAIRSAMLIKEASVRVKDFGAGSGSGEIKVRDIAQKALLPPKYGQLLFRLVNAFQPASVVELGTSLGITTLYLSMPSSAIPVFTIEGNEEIAEVAGVNFRRLKRENVELLKGEFDIHLGNVIHKIQKAGLVFIDGNHRYEPTMKYFQMFREVSDENTIMVFDDIYWSREMTKAWKEISGHPQVTLSLDLYRMGVIFFRKGVEKQYFRLRY